MPDLRLLNLEEEGRYDLRDGDSTVAFVEYRPAGEAIMLTHTEVPTEHEGKGLGSTVARLVLDDLRAQGKQVVPLCPFIKTYIQRHHEYLDLVSEQHRAAFRL